MDDDWTETEDENPDEIGDEKPKTHSVYISWSRNNDGANFSVRDTKDIEAQLMRAMYKLAFIADLDMTAMLSEFHKNFVEQDEA